MTQSKVLKTSLFVSGFILLVGGSYTVVDPHGFYVENGALLGDDVNLLNCVRATGAMLLTFGALMMSGLFSRRLTFTSSLLSAVVFLFYATGRATSILVDGVPSDELIKGTTIEFVVAALALVALWMHGASGAIQKMDRTVPLKAVLLVTGAMLITFGVTTLVAPQFLYGMQQVELGFDPNIVNFARAQGSTFLGCGLVIVAGVFVEKLTFSSTVISAAVFSSYGAGRAISWVVDGTPASKLMEGTFIELGAGAIVLVMLFKSWRPSDVAPGSARDRLERA